MNIKEINTKIAEHIVLTIGLTVLAFLCLGLFLGATLMAPPETEYITLPPEVITRTVEVVKEVVKYKTIREPYIVRETVIKEIEVGVMVEVPVKLRNFKDTDELDAFLFKDDTDSRIILRANSNGVISFEGQCEDIALQLQERAREAGYIMSIEIIGGEEVYKDVRCILTGRLHVINSVVIGNEFIFIEPGTDDFWVAAYLD